jgi:hypothetical protein
MVPANCAVRTAKSVANDLARQSPLASLPERQSGFLLVADAVHFPAAIGPRIVSAASF